MQDETLLLETHPSMWRNHPVTFSIVIILCFVLVGLPILLIWWLKSSATTLTVTTRRTTLTHGLLSKHTSEVMHEHVRNIQVDQSVLQRLFGVGRLAISSAGQAGMEIEIDGIPHPNVIESTIDRYR
jgi:uncharacterized membrane protein YdbT with pleckstrin-like domain